jgi:transposase
MFPSMSKLKNFVGIDISKLWFDAALIKTDNPFQILHRQFLQNPVGYKTLLEWLMLNNAQVGDQTLFCMENTGLYNTGLVNHLVGIQAQLWVEMPLRIKKTGGFERGSDDKTACVKIARYAMRYQEDVKLWEPADSNMEKIKNLITQRDRIINAVTQLSVPVKELKDCGCEAEAKQMEKIQKPALAALQKTKKNIEVLITKTVQQDEQINKKVALVQSIKGIGPVTAVALLVYTKSFDMFDNAKQLACYCGVVPFKKQSGTSVRYKPSVSPFANRKLKKLLHLCALSAIKNDKELHLYFERKVMEGKNKMSVINAVRNKLIHRVYAVLRDDRMFEENYVRRCA